MLYKYMDEYEKAFGDIFPTMEFMSASDENLINYIKECLNKNKPMYELYPIDYSDGKCY